MGMKIGILTGGGDCPGLNPVIRAAVKTSLRHGYQPVGIRNGWKGLVDADSFPLDAHAVSGIIHRGGTILGTSRTNPFKDAAATEKLKANFKKLGLDALIAIGGEDTLGAANKFYKEGFNVVGVPKTIDNDLNGTDFTFGFDTAVNIAMEAIDRLHSTAESHRRIMVVEVMGRHAGWIALHSGIAGGADLILIPEVPIKMKEVTEVIQKRVDRGKYFSIIVVAEGAKFDGSEVLVEKKLDDFGHVRLGGIGELLAAKIEEATKLETRVAVLGHIQRGGTATAFDRVLGTRFGAKAVELVQNKDFGKMVALRGTEIVAVKIEDAVKKLKTVEPAYYDMARTFFG
jgi:ATP-dependent phosphofructokinase / diphosphate-dependent phosphofructokinase